MLPRTLQESLIPPLAPSIPGLEVAAVYRPAGSGDEVGGDFYDVFEIDTDHWVVVIGDVCGKGVNAAVTTALARFTIRAAAVRFPELTDALANLNETLLAAETDRFCTMAIVRFRKVAGAWTMTVGCAGTRCRVSSGVATHRCRSVVPAHCSGSSTNRCFTRSNCRCDPATRSSSTRTASPRVVGTTPSSGPKVSTVPSLGTRARPRPLSAACSTGLGIPRRRPPGRHRHRRRASTGTAP